MRSIIHRPNIQMQRASVEIKAKLAKAQRLLFRRKFAIAAGKKDPLTEAGKAFLRENKSALLKEARKTALERRFAEGRRLGPMELTEIGLRGDDTQSPVEVPGLAGIAREIARILKIQCSREYIREWKTRHPPFPMAAPNNCYNVAQCVEWVQKNILAKRNGHAGNSDPDLFQRAATERARGDIAKEEHANWQREVERGAWVKKSDYVRAMAGAARIVQVMFDRELEIDAPRAGADILRNLGVSSDIIAEWTHQMMAHGVAFVDRRRREFGKRLKAEG